MKQICILSFLMLFFCIKSISQNNSSKKILCYELGKTGLVHNLYFDNKIANSTYGYRLGLGSNLGGYFSFGKLGLGVYKLIGNKNKFFEVGIDIDRFIVENHSADQIGLSSLVYPDYTTDVIIPNINIGYRSYSKKGRMFRIGISPHYFENKIILGGYISFGLKQF